MTAGWRECADPVELAAAVAAGVEVQCVAVDGRTWETGCEDSESFRRCMANDCRYRVPSSWSWSPSPVPPWPDGVLRDAANRLRWIANSGYIEDPGIKRIIRSWADELDATPVPPWPGAVLSGLVDEDGEPTWLAQAGQVRGEQVRRRSDLVWVNNDQMVAFPDTVWVEVRAPRAVAEPATERVPWWEAVGREVTDQDGERVPIEHVQCGDGAGPSVTAYNAAERRDTRLLRVPIPVRGDGTVEVLKDGDR